jgi:aldehyde:ferredoxin oxidoreductase
MVAYRNGFGDVLARGAGAAAEYIMDHEEFGPRRNEMEYLFQKVHPFAEMGGLSRHCLNGGYGYNKMDPSSTFYSTVALKRGQEPHGLKPSKYTKEWLLKWVGEDTDKTADSSYWGAGVAVGAIAMEQNSMQMDSMGLCAWQTQMMHQHFDFGPADECFNLSPDGTPEYWSAILGGQAVSHEELMKKMEKLVNLERAIWVRDGYEKRDMLHDCIFDEVDRDGNIVVPRDQFENLRQIYYQKRGGKMGSQPEQNWKN